MNTDSTPFETWQFFAAAKKIMGMSALQVLYQRSHRQIDRWACDPDFTASSEKNPLDRIEAMLTRMTELGKTHVAVAAADRMAAICGMRLVPDNTPEPDAGTLADELLDDYPAVVNFHSAIRERQPDPVVRAFLHDACGELNQTYKKYCDTPHPEK
jgi:hypothetical protein